MSNGRTRPLLFACEDSGERREVVVKLRSRELTQKAQIAELITAQLADNLGLDVPKAAVVEIPQGFETVVQNTDVVVMIQASVGKNFGTVHLGPAFTTWPPERPPHGNQRDQAAAIFAFDTLIQNPDRRAQNPNLWAKSDRLGVYDHEQAFSFLFLPILGGAPRPWNASDQAAQFRFLESHIFYASLRGSSCDLSSFAEKVSALSENRIQQYVESVPEEWSAENTLCQDIAAYLNEARQEAAKLVSFVKHILR